MIVDLLRAIRSRFEIGVKMQLIWSNGDMHCINDRATAEWMDRTRVEILELFASIANEAGIQPPRTALRPRW